MLPLARTHENFFALVEDGWVNYVMAATQEIIDSGEHGDPSRWVKCGHNIRKNFPAIGWTYDAGRDAFIPPKPYASWVLNETTCRWEAPTPMPTDGKRYNWDESTTSWVESEDQPV